MFASLIFYAATTLGQVTEYLIDGTLRLLGELDS